MSRRQCQLGEGCGLYDCEPGVSRDWTDYQEWKINAQKETGLRPEQRRSQAVRSTQRVLVTSRSLLNSAHFCHSLRPPFLSCAALSVAFSFSPITLPLCWVLVPQRPAHHHPEIPSSPDILSEGLLAKYVFLSFPNEAEAGPFPERRGSQSRRKECQRMRVQVLWEVRKELANSDEGSPKITLKK